MPDLLAYVKNLDVRTPQVAIKAKIVFVNRTDIEELGLSYDLGTGNDQFFSQLVQRIDPSTMQAGRHQRRRRSRCVRRRHAVQRRPRSSRRQRSFGDRKRKRARRESSAQARLLGRTRKIPAHELSSTLCRKSVWLILQAEPSIVTLDNRKAEILVGQEIPIRVLDLSTQGAAGGRAGRRSNVPRATVQLKEVGIILSVTPHITNNRQILLKLHAENSDAQLASSDVGFIFGKQRADNQLLVGDGETAVIGGLTVTQVTSSKSGIPLLVDLPIIGRLFGVTRTSEQKRDLLILVTPHIIDEGDRTLTLAQCPPAPRQTVARPNAEYDNQPRSARSGSIAAVTAALVAGAACGGIHGASDGIPATSRRRRCNSGEWSSTRRHRISFRSM